MRLWGQNKSRKSDNERQRSRVPLGVPPIMFHETLFHGETVSCETFIFVTWLERNGLPAKQLLQNSWLQGKNVNGKLHSDDMCSREIQAPAMPHILVWI